MYVTVHLHMSMWLYFSNFIRGHTLSREYVCVCLCVEVNFSNIECACTLSCVYVMCYLVCVCVCVCVSPLSLSDGLRQCSGGGGLCGRRRRSSLQRLCSSAAPLTTALLPTEGGELIEHIYSLIRSAILNLIYN